MTQHHLSKTPRPRASASASATTVLVVLAAAAALLVPSVQAGPVLWVGQGTNNLWDNPANWQPNTIPQPADDVTIPGGFDVLIGTANPATAGSITIGGGGGGSNTTASLHVIGATLTLGAGGLSLRAASQLLGNNAEINGNGTIRVLDTSLFDFYGNRVVPPVTVAGTAEARFSGAAARFSLGPWLVDGRLLIQGSGVANAQSVNVSRTGTLLATGNLQLSLQVRSNAGQVTSNVSTGYLTVVNTAPTGTVSLSGGINSLTVIGGVLRTIGTPGAGSAALTNVTALGGISAGTLSLTNSTLESGSGSSVYFKGDCYIGAVTAGRLICFSDGGSLHSQQVTVQGDSLNLGGCSVVAKTLSLSTGLGNPGPGTVTAENATIAFRGINNKINYTITGTATVTGTANFGGQFTVAPGAVVDISRAELFGEQGVGSWVNQGTTKVGDNLRARFTWFALYGAGVYSVGRNATFDIQNINATLGEIHFGGPSAEFTAEGVELGWGRLTGTADGERIGITTDMVYSECLSPCPGSPKRPRQQLFIEAR